MHSYEGDSPYIFLSYCHKDKEEVFSIAEKMNQSKYRIWYDKALDVGQPFDDDIAEHISGSKVFIIFLSESYLQSSYCDMELKYAKEKGCECFAIYLEDIDLSGHAGMEMILRPSNNIYKCRMREEEFLIKLLNCELLIECKYDEDDIKNEVSIREELQKRNILWYLLSALGVIASIFITILQSFGNKWYRDTGWLMLLQLVIFVCGCIMLYYEEKSYKYTAKHSSVISIMAIILIAINLNMLTLRISFGSNLNQIGGGIIVGIIHYIAFCAIGYQKKTLPNGSANVFIFYCIRSILVFIMICMFGYDYRWAALVQTLFNALGYLTVVGLGTSEKRNYLSIISGVLSFVHIIISLFIVFPKIFYDIVLLADWFSDKLYEFLLKYGLFI